MKIDDEFASLIPALTEDEYNRLEASILNEGCRDAIVLWGDIIVDGHNRYKICTEHNIEFRTIQKEFTSRDEAKLWMLQNQLSRRNLSDLDRVAMVRKCEDAVKAQAEKRMLAGKADPTPNSAGGESRNILANMAGVGRTTYKQATTILDKAPAPVIEATRNKELSINAAYEVTKLPEEQQAEIADRIEQGEKPRAVVAEVRAKENFQENAPVETSQSAESQALELVLNSTLNEDEQLITAPAEQLEENSELQIDMSSPIFQIPLKDFWATLSKGDLWDIPKHTVARYRKIYRELSRDDNYVSWTPASEEERSILTEFCKRYPDKGMAINFAGSSNNVEVKTPQICRVAFEPFLRYKLQGHYDDALKHPVPEKPKVEVKVPTPRPPVREFGKLVDIYSIEEKYNIIYAAPTWEGSQSDDELKKLPVNRIADENCALLLWADSTKIKAALEVIEKWGFSYQEVIYIWIKVDESGAIVSNDKGYWTSSNSEMCLLGLRGEMWRLALNVPQVQEVPVSSESSKPMKFRELTVKIFGDFPAIELFTDEIFSYESDTFKWDAWK